MKAATAYDDPSSGEMFILVMNQALYFGDQMENLLLCPNQMRSHGIVDDVPMHLSGGNSMHSTYFPTDEVRLPLDMHGCISYLPTRLPSKKEIEDCTWLELTSGIEWDPYASEFKQQEDQVREAGDEVNVRDRNICSVLSCVSNALDDECVYHAVMSQTERKVGATTSTKKDSIDKADLARR